MTVALVLPDRLTEDTVAPFPAMVDDVCAIDAGDLRWVDPAGLVQSALLMHLGLESATLVRFRGPLDPSVATYLARMDFYSHVPADVEVANLVRLADLNRQDRGDVLIELKHQMEDHFPGTVISLRFIP